MNEIEKMMQNAGIEPKKKCYYWDCPYSTGMPANDIPYAKRNCQDCNNPDKAVYPPFTAEKQISLIKWIAESKEECRITYEKEYKWCTQTDWQSSFCYDNFPASLANLVNNLWQDLTDADKAQIKNILESEVRE